MIVMMCNAFIIFCFANSH